MDSRLQSLTTWLSLTLPDDRIEISPLAGDASFRRYFRVQGTKHAGSQDAVTRHWIVMDAPPEQEDCHPFTAIALSWKAEGINVPKIHALDLAQGFILLDDFGDGLYLPALNHDSADELYTTAIDTLIKIQQSAAVKDHPLPAYTKELLQREMSLFRDWLITQKLAYTLSATENALLEQVFSLLINNALTQPQVPVHRDYHSRNLMICDESTPGVLDFQDAVLGPITYDLVSLLKDCYIVWPESQVNKWTGVYLNKAKAAELTDASLEQFSRWFNLMGMQRHLKASGIFARLSLRDGKHGYLADIPRTVDYIVQASSKFPELSEFTHWLRQTIMPLIHNLATETQSGTQ